MASMFANAARGFAFFSLCWPSFSRLGFEARRWQWPPWQADFRDQTWLVTGASRGIGRELALRAAEQGARVVAVARDERRLEELAADAAGTIVPHPTDLSSMASVLELPASVDHVHVLVNNVGVMLAQPTRTAEGLDTGFATNLLGHYLLTETLAEQGKLTPGAVVVNMSSGGAYNVPLALDALTDLRPYDGTIAYAYHKRAQLALNAHWRRARGDALRAYVMHPGWVDTPGVADSMPLFRAALGPILRDPAAGADTALWLAATRPEQRSVESLWFDRAEATSHLLPGTRRGASSADLVELLEAHRRELAPA